MTETTTAELEKIVARLLRRRRYLKAPEERAVTDAKVERLKADHLRLREQNGENAIDWDELLSSRFGLPATVEP